jgi:hypothetical protein
MAIAPWQVRHRHHTPWDALARNHLHPCLQSRGGGFGRLDALNGSTTPEEKRVGLMPVPRKWLRLWASIDMLGHEQGEINRKIGKKP